MSSNLEPLPDHPSAVPIQSLVPSIGKSLGNFGLVYRATVARGRGSRHAAPCIGDIIVLLDGMPRRPAELAWSGGGSYCVAHIQDVDRNGYGFEIRASRKIEDASCYALAVSLLSFIPYARIWRCLDYDAAVKRNPTLVKVVAGDAQVHTHSHTCPTLPTYSRLLHALSFLTWPTLLFSRAHRFRLGPRLQLGETPAGRTQTWRQNCPRSSSTTPRRSPF